MAANEFGERVADDVGAMLDRPAQIGRGHGVIDDERQACLLGDSRNSGDVLNDAAGIGDGFHENGAGLGGDCRLHIVRVRHLHPVHVPVELLEGMAELIDRAAIELAGRNEVVAGLHERVEDQKLRAMTRSSRKCSGAAFEGRNAVFKDCLGRVHDAGVDVAELLQAEQAGGMIHIVKHVGRGLVDGCCAGAGGGVRCGAGVDGAGGKALVAHERYSLYGLKRGAFAPSTEAAGIRGVPRL